jgi:glycosyltransferase involved in cell wall biosynthesis
MQSDPDLAIVIPVYNEEKYIKTLLQDWLPVFRDTGVNYRVILIDDGSSDNSLTLLKIMQLNDHSLDVHTQLNTGHGPAILKGYRLASAAAWIFQIDSDHQLDTKAFTKLWANRERYDLLLAERRVKNASAGRQYISFLSSALVRLFYGSQVKDVNSPYRLMRGAEVREAIKKIPGNSFAPNVLLTAWFVGKKKKIFTSLAETRKENPRQSSMNTYFLRGAMKSFLQTLIFRIKL